MWLREQDANERVGGCGADELHDDEHRCRRGAMPAKVSERVRAMVTAGLAKLVEEVKK